MSRWLIVIFSLVQIYAGIDALHRGGAITFENRNVMSNLEHRLRIYTVRDRRVVSAALRRLFIRLKTSQIVKGE